MTIDKIVSKVAARGSDILSGGLNIRGTIPDVANDLMNIRSRMTNFGRGMVHDELKRGKR